MDSSLLGSAGGPTAGSGSDGGAAAPAPMKSGLQGIIQRHAARKEIRNGSKTKPELERDSVDPRHRAADQAKRKSRKTSDFNVSAPPSYPSPLPADHHVPPEYVVDARFATPEFGCLFRCHWLTWNRPSPGKPLVLRSEARNTCSFRVGSPAYLQIPSVKIPYSMARSMHVLAQSSSAPAEDIRMVPLDGGRETDGFLSNNIKTAKYNPVTFLPIFLFEMFSRIAYLYFLFQVRIQL